jgi:hypothetical protein
MREAAAALALAVDGDGHSSREKRRAFVALGKWAVLLYARVTQATMAQWSEAAQLPSSSPLLPSTFEGLASRNTPIVEGEERTGNRDFSVAMQRAAGLHAPLTGRIDETDQRTVDPFTAVPRGFC